MKLNLGCGSKIMEGYRNFDLYPVNDMVEFLDLNKLPLPFADNSIDEIVLCHVLEHLSCNPFNFISECRRILKPGGVLNVTLPGYSYRLEHERGFHTSGYLDCLYEPVSKDNVYLKQFSFILVRKKRFSNPLFMVRKFVEFLHALGTHEYSWVLRKE